MKRLKAFWKFFKSIVSFGASDYRADYERRIAGDD